MFSDGVIAIILTIMVLELKATHLNTISDVFALYPVFISYILSFAFISIYWVNHHHLLSAARGVNSKILWSNIFLLFSLSLIPWATSLMGENHFDKLSVIIYTLLCVFPALGYRMLSSSIRQSKNPDSRVLKVLECMKTKEMVSLVLYVFALICSFFSTWVALVLVAAVSAVWIFPNKKIEEIFE